MDIRIIGLVSRRVQILAALAVLALVTGVLYHGTLSDSWRGDDGAHLGFVSTYAPWQYFFIPEVTREFSASLTPWNALPYSINLALFGVHPAGFYAHQLFSLWLAAAVTVGFLRLWLPLRWALFGAVLFLVAPPTAHVASELMTGHYLEGLVFAIGAAWCFVLALRRDSWRYALAAAALYLLATTCKEIYVPLPVVLLVLPEGHWRSRARFLVPFGVVGLAYVGWRYAVLGQLLGGYKPAGTGYGEAHALQQLANIPTLLLGKNNLSYIALACIAAVSAWALARRPRHMPFVLVAATVVIGPLVPLTLYPGLYWADRYFFLVWWLAAVLLAAALASSVPNRHLCLAAAIVILAGTAVRGRWELLDLRAMHSSHASYLRFAVSSSENDVLLLPKEHRDYLHQILNGIVYAQYRRHPEAPVRSLRFVGEEMLPLLDTSVLRVFRHDPLCRCLYQLPAGASRPPHGTVASLGDRELSLDVVTLAPPYQAMPEVPASGGQVESIEVQGSTVTLGGWAQMRFDTAQPRLIVASSVLPVSKEVVRTPRTTAAWSQRSPDYIGFRIKLQYASEADATRSAGSACVASASSRIPITLLDNPKNPGCTQLGPK